MSRVLLIAGESFLGKYVHALLAQLEHDVVATTRAAPERCCELGDAADVEGVVRAISPNWIINCAGVMGGDGERMQRVHVEGASHLLHAVAWHAPAATVTFFGSAAEYGNVEPQDLPIREDQPCRPLSPYGRSKVRQTNLACELAARHGLRVLVVRPFNVVGPGLPERYMPAALARRLALNRNGSPDVRIADAGATRDWIDVRDVAAAVAALLAHDLATPGEAGLYNVATGVETPVLTVAAELCRLAGDFQAVPASGSCSGIQRSCGDAARLRRATGWAPWFSWQRSIADLWRHYRFPAAIP